MNRRGGRSVLACSVGAAERTYAINDQVLFGRDLLVAPVLRAEATERGVYLPAGDWYDFWNGRRHTGSTEIRVQVALESIPIYVRGGAFVFRQAVVQHTGELSGQPLHVYVYPAAESEASLYEDDGATREYLGASSCSAVSCSAAAAGPARSTSRRLRAPGAPTASRPSASASSREMLRTHAQNEGSHDDGVAFARREGPQVDGSSRVVSGGRHCVGS